MVKTLMDTAIDEMERRPLVSVDCLLETLSLAKQGDRSIHTSDLLKLFCEAVLRGAEISTAHQENDPIVALFDRGLRQQQLRFIAICLLRLLAAHADIFTKDSYLRVEAFKLFDRTLSHDLYKLLNIDESEQTFQKESKLKDPILQIESEVGEILASVHSLDMVSNFRSIFMQKIKALFAFRGAM